MAQITETFLYDSHPEAWKARGTFAQRAGDGSTGGFDVTVKINSALLAVSYVSFKALLNKTENDHSDKLESEAEVILGRPAHTRVVTPKLKPA